MSEETNYYDESSDTYWSPSEPVVTDYPTSGGIDDGGFNPVSDLPAAEPISIGSDVYYYNADGSYTGTNTETGESFAVTPEQMVSLQNPQATGNASMSSLQETAYKEKLMDPSFVSKLNAALGTKLTGSQFLGMGAVGLGALAGAMGANNPTITKVGYQGGIPDLQAERNMLAAPPAGHRPGSGGINWGGDVTYSPKGSAPVAPADASIPTQDLYTKYLGREPDAEGLAFWQSKFGPNATADQQTEFKAAAQHILAGKSEADQKTLAPNLGIVGANPGYEMGKTSVAEAPAQPIKPEGSTVQETQGGIMNLARGGSTGRYLQGSTDGMADKLKTSIDGHQPAALSHGEFVIPADVVSHLGNGNSDAGAKKLYSMMDKIREARTGTKKQGKEIDADKFMPGGLAKGYAQGGTVQNFAAGGATDTGVGSVASGVTGVEQGLSSWAGDYVTNMLGKGQALANAPVPQYQGPLTAGASGLQNQAFNAAGNLQVPGSIGQAAQTAGQIGQQAQGMAYTPQTTSFGTEQAQQYMNPYLQQSLAPQLAEARRQSDITAQQNAAAMTKAGAFGGGRQAILTSENQRNLGTKLADVTGQGYNTAYTNAMQQFNADQARKAQENQFGATYGLQGLQTGLQAAQAQGTLGASQNQQNLQNIQQQAALGTTQRGIESEGIAADKAAFEAARKAPYEQVQFQQSLLSGLPITAQNYQLSQPSALSSAAAGAVTVDKLLATLGLSPTQAATTTAKP